MARTIELDDILSHFDSPELLSDEGGQKVVYTVDLPQHGRSILKIGSYSSESSLIRIQREVEILRELRSAYFPQNYDFVIVDENRYFILEEYIDGGTLAKKLEHYSHEQHASALISELITGLSILWERRVVHRDLKPHNIIINNGQPVIIDLGIARMLDSTSLTKTFAPSGPGTPAYASPEQIENRKKDIDFRSDQFNLGIIFAQLMLGGNHPFRPDLVGNNSSIVENILADEWAREQVSSVMSDQGFAVVSRMLGNEPYKRYRKVEELHEAVRSLLRG